MDPASANRARAAINRVGQLVSFRRMTSTNPQTISAQADVKAAPAGFSSDAQLVAGVTTGKRKFIVSRLDLVAAGFPVPLKKGDRVLLTGDRITTIDSVDLDHREYLDCYDITVSGA